MAIYFCLGRPYIVISGRHRWAAQASPPTLLCLVIAGTCGPSLDVREQGGGSLAGHLLPRLHFVFSLLHPQSSNHRSRIGLARIWYFHGQIRCPGLWIYSLSETLVDCGVRCKGD